MRSLRILKVTEDLRPEADAGAVQLPALLTALSGTLRALSISTLACQAPLLQLTFLTRSEVLGLTAEAVPILPAFRNLRGSGVLQLKGMWRESKTPLSWECEFCPAVKETAEREEWEVFGLRGVQLLSV